MFKVPWRKLAERFGLYVLAGFLWFALISLLFGEGSFIGGTVFALGAYTLWVWFLGGLCDD